MFKKVHKFYKRHQPNLETPDTSYDYEAFVNAEDRTMEFGMDSTTGQVDERIAFGPMAKGQKRYGSTSTRQNKDEVQGFSYTVKRGDTLQGLAVKFGVTTEQIRRTNQLWTNDSLFLRDKLIIPIQLDNGNLNGQSSTSSVSSIAPEDSGTTTTNGSSNARQQNVSSQANVSNGTLSSTSEVERSFQSPESMSTGSKHWTHPLSDSFEYDEGITTPDSIKLDTPSSPNSVTAERSILNPHNQNSYHQNGAMPYADNGRSDYGPHSQISDHSEKTANEFLSRIDIAIASTKQKALPMTQNCQQWVTFESDSESEQHLNRSRTSLHVDGRHLRHSLRKLEKKQEELFQL